MRSEPAQPERARWNTPLSLEHADLLGGLLLAGGAQRILDLGCGSGALLLRLVATVPGNACTGVGVDTDAELLARGREAAHARDLDERVRFEQSDAAAWSEPGDAIVCIGTSHALGGTGAALSRLAELLAPGGRILFGDGCWERPPSEAAEAIFGEEVLPLPEIVGRARQAGLRVLHLSTADQREWDEFESGWRRERLAALPGGRFTAAQLEERLHEYLAAYRGVLGFCYLVLDRVP